MKVILQLHGGVGYMSRKEVISKNELLRCAFEQAREEGLTELTARKLAARAGCSTQPIFRLYKSMDELVSEVMEHAVGYFERYYSNAPKDPAAKPFVNLGMTYISFAKDEPKLFQILFLRKERQGRSLYEMLNGKAGNVMAEINQAKAAGCKDPQDLFMQMWIHIHGAASMVITGDFDLNDDQTKQMLQNAYNAFSGR